MINSLRKMILRRHIRIDVQLNSWKRILTFKRSISESAKRKPEHDSPTSGTDLKGTKLQEISLPSSPAFLSQLVSDNEYAKVPGLLIKQPEGFSFGGGPGAVRQEVKIRAASEILDGSLLEMSHREVGQIQQLLSSTQQVLRNLLAIPKTHEILFIQGGAHAQFAAIPLNFGHRPRVVGLNTGSWSKKALLEQEKFAQVTILDFKDNLTNEKEMKEHLTRSVHHVNADYAFLCLNETMNGCQIRNDELISGEVPLVVDATSDLLSRKIDVSKYGVIMASSGKNLGPAGFAVVIVRKDILENKKESEHCPSFMNWREYANSKPVQNIYQTPPMLSIGICRMVLDDLQARGGVPWAEHKSSVLSSELYNEIDGSDGFYANYIPRSLRSHVSVVFSIPNRPDLEKKFIKRAESKGLLQIHNHPSVGGMRASLYNAVPVEAVDRLVQFMREFKSSHA